MNIAPAAGTLRHRVQIQALTEAASSSGGYTETWATVATVWARVEPIGSREFWAEAAKRGEITHRITLRYYAGLTSKHRFLYGTRVMDILAPLDIDERHGMVQALCKEVDT